MPGFGVAAAMPPSQSRLFPVTQPDELQLDDTYDSQSRMDRSTGSYANGFDFFDLSSAPFPPRNHIHKHASPARPNSYSEVRIDTARDPISHNSLLPTSAELQLVTIWERADSVAAACDSV